ncbi:MAG: hypothetical protein NZ709_01955 [Candidatus Marinimicrobia bacterium]|nr:hypothetical protein [Candidatus Neomarinimicrobiota bacterium]
MKELYFTSPYRKSLRTIRLEYGQVKKKFVLRTFEGNIIGRRVSEGSPKEEIFDDEKELLKKVYETKKGLLEGRWIVKNKQSFSKPSFLKTEIIDGKVSFEFSVDIDPVKLDEQKTKIEEYFVENLGKEIETNIRKGDRKKEEL